jgi:uncharacterized protein involved in exopolysaccharide biosynthesis
MAEENEALDLRALCELLWRNKWIIIACGSFCGVIAVIYVFTATSWYRADTVLTPADTKSGQGLAGQLGSVSGLASLAGINIGGSSPQSTEALAVLQSRDFVRVFIEEEHLFPLLMSKLASPLGLSTAPDIRDGVKYFQEEILFVQQDKKTGLVTLAVEWTDSNIAAAWANILVGRLNDRMRQRALTDAEFNTAYLQKAMESASIVTIQQSIGHLLESELQKLMIAKGNREYSFRVIDQAVAPKRRARPKRVLIVAAALVIGSGLSIIVLIARNVIWRPREYLAS